MLETLKKKLRVCKEAKLTRTLTPVTCQTHARIMIDDKRLVNFSSNDYLGLSFDESIKAAFCDGINQYGVGSGGSTVVCGFDKEKKRFQDEFSDFVSMEHSLYFSSGYNANLSVISALFDTDTDIFIDKMSHASIYDALALKGLPFKRYRHLDVEHLSQLLQQSQARSKLIISEGVFSMTGSVAPLAALGELKRKHNALLYIDDAHAIGVRGHGGRGSASSSNDIDILVSPLGKAFASSGAVVSCDEIFIQGVVQFARPYIYSTALPAAYAVCLQTILKKIKEATKERKALQENIDFFKSVCAGLPFTVLPSDTAIQLLCVGDNERALALTALLKEKHFYCYAMRTPTVPKAYTGLRIVLTASHTEKDISSFCDALKECHALLH